MGDGGTTTTVSSRAATCHPERSEGSGPRWHRLATVQIPRFARDDSAVLEMTVLCSGCVSRLPIEAPLEVRVRQLCIGDRQIDVGRELATLVKCASRKDLILSLSI